MKKTTIILFTILAFWACQKIDPVKPPEELPMNYGTLIEDTLYVTAVSLVGKERENTYNSPK
ncbi:MAG TPA: hypothetical protein ENO27_02615, partial [Caldithrix sp.]|nr:hypothetical protein [Caldithrix sp.]